MMFSAARGVFLRPLPFPQDDSLVSLWTHNRMSGVERRTAPADFFDWRDQSVTLTHLGGHTPSELNVLFDGTARHLVGATVTIGFFETLGVRPVLGRLFRDRDFERSAPGAVVVTESFWRRELGGERSALGRTITVASRPYSIVGVAPDLARFDTRAELWVPMAIDRAQASRRARFLSVIGRKRPTSTLSEVEAEMGTIAQRLEASYPETNTQTGIGVSSLRDALLRDIPEKMITLWGAVAGVLLMICANISLLLLASIAHRKEEFSVRVAVGANHRQIAVQLLTETMIMAFMGGALGILVAAVCLALARQVVPDPVLIAQVQLDGMTALFSLCLSLFVGLAIGLMAVSRVPRHDLRSALVSGSRETRKSFHLQKALVVTEVTIAVVLLVATGLMLRSLQKLWALDPGYDVDAISTVSVLFPPRTYPPGSEQMGNFIRQATEVLEALPEVDHAASGVLAPLEGVMYRTVKVAGLESAGQNEARMIVNGVSSTYFETVGLEIKAGRAFARHERGGVALANEALVSLFFGGEPVLGRNVTMDSPLSREPHRLELVGVVESERRASLTEEPGPTLYVPHELELMPMATLYVRRIDRSTVDFSRAIQEALRGIDFEVAVGSPRSMRTIFRDSLNEESTVTLWLGVSGGIAWVLSLLSVYGVWALFVSHRQREFGIRLSLGARPGVVLKEVLLENLKLTIVGLGTGILLALSMTRLIEHWLFQVHDTDPGTLLAIVALVSGAAVLAGFLPAWKASRVDVMEILRDV